MPATSVFAPRRTMAPAASRSSSSVLAAPASRAVSSTRSRSGSTSRLSGMVSERPRQSDPRPATNAPRSAPVHSTAS
ncbi:hypothetical protein BC477_12905 [Clavibacter michiganensis subsp. michiganensis]|uniref:Uncharacterized protein n=1 Tax=Clavibacter michiganensis subsp. michiganensis TaxID=33013 RepID=A0A251XI04_CLAMM|nr:hypothetical protein BC477_12905 [Clavibacter michiganensis subsp. michiganensis]OUE02694.1 hypothetical protein CMMCAS07_11810 [Clavibacter michiganensis subsp. michiganensis]